MQITIAVEEQDVKITADIIEKRRDNVSIEIISVQKMGKEVSADSAEYKENIKEWLDKVADYYIEHIRPWSEDRDGPQWGPVVCVN